MPGAVRIMLQKQEETVLAFGRHNPFFFGMRFSAAFLARR